MRPERRGVNPGTARVLRRPSRATRMVMAFVVLALVTAGTLAGSDNDFPFGPFRMYATRDDPNGVVRQALVQAVYTDGRVRDVTDTSGAPRRAELEGRLSQFRADPGMFAAVADRYPHGGGVRQIRLVWRGFPLRHGRSGRPTYEVIATWTPPETASARHRSQRSAPSLPTTSPSKERRR